jgi:hypothetical protein
VPAALQVVLVNVISTIVAFLPEGLPVAVAI